MTTWVSLLRGINLGGHNKVPMPALRKALEAVGFDAVRTYVQSGNLVTESDHESAGGVAAVVHDVVAAEFGIDVPVLVRSPAQLAAVVASNPFPAAALDRPRMLHVSFLVSAPPAAAVQRLMADPLAAERCRVVGQDLYLDYGAGVHGSRLTPDFLRRRLGVDGTARNWRTVLALHDLCR
ncbi:MAG TPA: DUF1697 domain-containing protein [Nocardioidaceae bacterium]|nr:DUF1697 domain-containing protein [Nocardioidaceae bacterium]